MTPSSIYNSGPRSIRVHIVKSDQSEVNHQRVARIQSMWRTVFPLLLCPLRLSLSLSPMSLYLPPFSPRCRPYTQKNTTVYYRILQYILLHSVINCRILYYTLEYLSILCSTQYRILQYTVEYYNKYYSIIHKNYPYYRNVSKTTTFV